MNLINLPLDNKKWIATETPKTHVIWHGSFSRTKYTNGQAKDIITRWNSMAEKYGTPYVIERDGTVYQTFPDYEWIYHLNLPASRGQYDKTSIGITIANELQLIRAGNRNYAFEYTQPSNLYTGPTFEYSWRGYKHWARIDDHQADACIALTLQVCDAHKIKPVFYAGREWNRDVWADATIFTHASVNRNVTDLIIEDWFIAKIKAAGITIIS